MIVIEFTDSGNCLYKTYQPNVASLEILGNYAKNASETLPFCGKGSMPLDIREHRS